MLVRYLSETDFVNSPDTGVYSPNLQQIESERWGPEFEVFKIYLFTPEKESEKYRMLEK